MNPLVRIEDFYAAVDRVKRGAAAYQSNWFAKPEQAANWCRRGLLSYRESDRSVLLSRKSQGFRYLYHAASDASALGGALAAVAAGDLLVADLVGPRKQVAAAAEAYHEAGFDRKRVLIRMVRKGGVAHGAETLEEGVRFAESDDFDAAALFLDEQLNPLFDQNPEPDELKAAIEARAVLVVRSQAAVDGLLYFESTGLSSYLRYWYVSRRARGGGVGGRLMRSYLRLCAGCRRISLWVKDENDDAIAKYRHFGFEREPLEDQIMIREAA